MEELEKVATPMTVREYLNTLDTEKFVQVFIFAVSNLELKYMSTELDAADIVFSVEYDAVEWLNSLYCEDKELLPLSVIENDEDEFYSDDLDD